MQSDVAKDVETVGRISAVPAILDVICRLTGMGFAAVARVTEDRWIACSVKDSIGFGLAAGDELKLETTICNEIRQHQQAVVINEVSADPAWKTHHTPEQYGFESYISMPIILPGGRFFGTLCAIDPKPHQLDRPEIRGMFSLFAELIAHHLDDAEALELSETSLRTERADALVREQFIAVLGHDLRNPLSAIDAGMQILASQPLTPRQTTVVGLVRSSVSRMVGLVGNVLDFARGRMGQGITVQRTPTDLGPVIAQVVDELHIGAPAQRIETSLDFAAPVNCDGPRIAQLVSNLLGNALTHGATDQPVRIEASSTASAFSLSVTNAGETISPEMMERLFQPFARGDIQPAQAGLGLGLYIASEIANAHGGTLDVESASGETRFTLTIPQA